MFRPPALRPGHAAMRQSEQARRPIAIAAPTRGKFVRYRAGAPRKVLPALRRDGLDRRGGCGRDRTHPSTRAEGEEHDRPNRAESEPEVSVFGCHSAAGLRPR